MYCQTDDLSSILCLDQINIGYNSLGHQFLSTIFLGRMDYESGRILPKKDFARIIAPSHPMHENIPFVFQLILLEGQNFKIFSKAFTQNWGLF